MDRQDGTVHKEEMTEPFEALEGMSVGNNDPKPLTVTIRMGMVTVKVRRS
jgi:hypothetical protein